MSDADTVSTELRKKIEDLADEFEELKAKLKKESSEWEHPNITGVRIANPHTVFRGLTYGQWVSVWSNQLLSAQPDIYYGEGGSMAFLRGNVEYAFKDDPEHRVYSLMTKDTRLKLREGAPVFVPIVNTMFLIGDEYEGQVMKDEIAMRNNARRDTS